MVDANKKFGTFEISCDFCEESDMFDTHWNFRAFIDQAKNLGWTMHKEGDNWVHRCQSCSLEEDQKKSKLEQ